MEWQPLSLASFSEASHLVGSSSQWVDYISEHCQYIPYQISTHKSIVLFVSLSRSIKWGICLSFYYFFTLKAECNQDFFFTFLSQTNPAADHEKEAVEKQTSGSWWGLLKYSLVLLVPGFLNHAALYREGEMLRPTGQLKESLISTNNWYKYASYFQLPVYIS